MSRSAPKTFRRQLILYNLLVVIGIAGFVSIYSYTSYRKNTIAGETRNSVHLIGSISDRLEVAYDEMVNIVLNYTERKSLFSTTTNRSDQPEYDERIPLYASSALKDFCALSGYSSYIYKITLFYKDEYLLQAGTSVGALDDAENIMAAPWFADRLTRRTAAYSLSMADNPFPLGRRNAPAILPLVRPLQNHLDLPAEDAWFFLGISPRLFSDALQPYAANQIIYTVSNEGDIIAAIGSEQYDTAQLTAMLLSQPETVGQLEVQLGSDACIVVYQKQPTSGLLIYEILPIKDMYLDKQVILKTILFVFISCIMIGGFFSLFISHQLGRPLRRLRQQLEIISQGNFKGDATIETNDEIGMIGIQINEMSSHISELLDTRIQSEKEKRNLEIKMLQAQINPHFLYNTLDSIKWIAMMQKNSSIVQIVTALSSLLKNMAKGFNEKVTLQQELDFLQSYITIEQIRYIELFDVEIQIDDPHLYDARIIKLTLQPIVENAIFSGIEPSGRFGIISIRAYTEEDCLYITITDNGVGISPEDIRELLADTSRVTRSNMSGIGLPNVDRRIKLVYGEAYGLTIESELDQYTCITIILPLEF